MPANDFICLETLNEIAAFWNLALEKIHAEVIPAGSPERTLFRTVVEDKNKKRFVLERISPTVLPVKLKIVETLEFLHQRRMPWIVPYLPGSDGKYIQERGGEWWQLVPFSAGVPLDRETYLYEGWRARVLSRFLLELKEKARDIPSFRGEKPFSIKEYVHRLVGQIEKHDPLVLPRLGPVLEFLERDFLSGHDRLPVSFCHGDYHPLNIVWAPQDMVAVIDWEFCGIKPEIYDLANMTGCLGMEHPSSLTDDLVVGLVKELRSAAVFSLESWDIFLEFVVALRFAWLSEWLRKRDDEMIALELDYMDLLIDLRPKLLAAWGI